MNILAIDPSYTRTGLALIYKDDNGIEQTRTSSSKNGGACYHDISQNHKACEELWNEIKLFSTGVLEFDVVIEYPALATRSGAYLAIMNGFLASRLKRWYKVRDIYWIPPTACNSFTKNKLKTKSYIVQWVKSFYKAKINHDEATALVFIKLYEAIKNKQYKNAYFIDKFEGRQIKNHI